MNHKPFVTTELKPLPDAVQELIAERDEWKARCEFSFSERDKLSKERDALKAELARPESTVVSLLRAERDAMTVEAARLNSGWCKANEAALEAALKADALKAENEKLHALRHEREDVISGLKDAARLALDALEPYKSTVLRIYTPQDRAIAALKAVL